MNELLLSIIAILIAALAYFLKNIMDDNRKMTSHMGKVTPAIIEMQSKFETLGHSIAFPITVTPGSPLKLTDIGEQVLKDYGFYKIFKKSKEQLVTQVITRSPKTNYDIQQESFAVIRETFESDDPIFAPIKDYAYNKGSSIEVVIPPAGIVLRDEVMKTLKF